MKQHGFSLIEVLVTLTLCSAILVLIMQSLNHIALITMRIEQKIEAQDNALTALLLLKQQVQSASVRECANPAAQVQNLTDTMEFNDFSDYQVLRKNSPILQSWHLGSAGSGEIAGNTVLLLHQPIARFYLNLLPDKDLLSVPVGFKADKGAFVVVDDCHKILLSTVSSLHYRKLMINGFHARDFDYPLSVSLIQNRLYYLGKTSDPRDYNEYALYRSSSPHKQREAIIPDLNNLEFSRHDNRLLIQIKAEDSNAIYHASI